MEVSEGYTPIYDGDKVIGAYGKIEGPVNVQLANREATEAEIARFEDALRAELPDLLEPKQSILFE